MLLYVLHSFLKHILNSPFKDALNRSRNVVDGPVLFGVCVAWNSIRSIFSSMVSADGWKVMRKKERESTEKKKRDSKENQNSM